MTTLTEIRIHGRGGQGNVVAAYLMAAAAIRAGYEAQAFPAFGAERRGAPVTAFVRICRDPIRRRSEVEHPDFLIVQDAKLLQMPATMSGLREGGGVLVNAESAAELPPALRGNERLILLPANRISEEAVGRRVPNVPLIAAFFALTGIVPTDVLFAALGERFETAVAARNRAAAENAIAMVTPSAWAVGSPVEAA